MATATIGRWGNANAIRLPKILCEELGLKANDIVSVQAKNNKIVIEKSKTRTNRKPVNIEQLFNDWDGQYELPSDLEGENCEVSWGNPVGSEM